MINTVLFDLDGTLLPIGMNEFERIYFKSLTKKFEHVISPERLIHMMSEGLKVMVENVDQRTNEDVFVEHIKKYLDHREFEWFQETITHFYENEFDVLKEYVQPNVKIQEAVKRLKEKGYECIVATNPMFPKLAITKRIEWAGFNRDDFTYVTSFEKNHFCKPQVHYYQEVLSHNKKTPQECLMVGNDEVEDLVASTLGIKTYLITDHVLARENAFVPDHKGDYSDFLQFVESLEPLI